MSRGAFMPWFPEPGSYIRQFLGTNADGTPVYGYRQLLWRRDPLKYPYRFASQAAGNKSTNGKSFDELECDTKKKHIYLAYLGVKPGFRFFLWHPYDIKNLKWDEDVTTIDENLTANLTYQESPYEYPTKMIGIQGDRYPNVQPMNISGETKCAEIIFVAALYKVREHADLTSEEVSQLNSRQLRSFPIDFGGEL